MTLNNILETQGIIHCDPEINKNLIHQQNLTDKTISMYQVAIASVVKLKVFLNKVLQNF
jgi:hypothetical protein